MSKFAKFVQYELENIFIFISALFILLSFGSCTYKLWIEALK